MTQQHTIPKQEQPALPDRERDTYDPHKDIEGCFNLAYSTIRERVANGGPSWKPRGQE